MNFDFDVKRWANGSPGPHQVWGSNWRVTGASPCCNQSMDSFAYSNLANGDHSEIWPIAYATVHFSVIGGYNSRSLKISCNLSWDMSAWSWTGSQN